MKQHRRPLLCRALGVWPTWCTGVRTEPFGAHAWLSVDGEPVGEPAHERAYTPTIPVPPAPNARAVSGTGRYEP